MFLNHLKAGFILGLTAVSTAAFGHSGGWSGRYYVNFDLRSEKELNLPATFFKSQLAKTEAYAEVKTNRDLSSFEKLLHDNELNEGTLVYEGLTYDTQPSQCSVLVKCSIQRRDSDRCIFTVSDFTGAGRVPHYGVELSDFAYWFNLDFAGDRSINGVIAPLPTLRDKPSKKSLVSYASDAVRIEYHGVWKKRALTLGFAQRTSRPVYFIDRSTGKGCANLQARNLLVSTK